MRLNAPNASEPAHQLAGVIRSFHPHTLIDLNPEEGHLLDLLAPDIDQGFAETASPVELLQSVLAHHPNLFLAPNVSPPRVDLAFSNGLLDQLPEDELRARIEVLSAVAPMALHRVACHLRTPQQPSVRNWQDWWALLQSADANLLLGGIAFEDGDPERPWAIFIKGHPAFGARDAGELLAGAESLADCGLAVGAEILLRTRLQNGSCPDRQLLELALGNLILFQDRLEDAEAQFLDVVNRFPEEPLAYVNLCGVQVRQGRREAAMHWASIARTKFPRDPDISELSNLLASFPAPSPARTSTGSAPRAHIGILSGFYPQERFNSQVNHKAYADFHGYHYIFNNSPERDPRLYFRKIETIRRYLDLFDWVFWIDDDAYFTDFSVPLARFVEQGGGCDLVICRSPSTKTLFTKFSSGQFLLRNSPRACQFLDALLEVELSQVKAFWRQDLGYFSEGDQDAMVYLSETDPRFREGFFCLLDHAAFNNRDFEYVQRLDEHFLVHFTGQAKVKSKAAFCARLGVNPYLVPADLLAPFQTWGWEHLG